MQDVKAHLLVVEMRVDGGERKRFKWNGHSNMCGDLALMARENAWQGDSVHHLGTYQKLRFPGLMDGIRPIAHSL